MAHVKRIVVVVGTVALVASGAALSAFRKETTL